MKPSKTTTFRGELYESKDGACIGCIHKADGGYVVRIPDGRTIGPVAFNGKVFQGSDFRKFRTLRLSASRDVSMYVFA